MYALYFARLIIMRTSFWCACLWTAILSVVKMIYVRYFRYEDKVAHLPLKAKHDGRLA